MRSLGIKFRTETLCATPTSLGAACTGAALVINRYGTTNNAITPDTFAPTPAWSSCAIVPVPASCTTGAAPVFSGNQLISSTSGPTCGTSAKSGAGLITQCSMLVTDPNLKNPRSVQWNLDLQRAITNNLTLDVAYVGVHGWNEIHSIDLNEPALGSGWDHRAAQFSRAHGLRLEANSGRSGRWRPSSAPATSLHCRQHVAEQCCEAVRHQVSLFPIHRSNHEWIYFQLRRIASDLGFPELPRPELPGLVHLRPRARRLDEELAGDGGAGQPGEPAISVRKQRLDVRHRFRFSPTYAIPGMKSPGQMLEGWQVSAIWAWQSGFAWAPNDATTR